MKNQAIAIFSTLLVILTMVSESDCFVGPVPNGKREIEKKVWKMRHPESTRKICLFANLHLTSFFRLGKRITFPQFEDYLSLGEGGGTSATSILCFHLKNNYIHTVLSLYNSTVHNFAVIKVLVALA